MTNIYEAIINPVTGESFRCISADENNYIMDWVVQPNGYVPFEHIHLHQDEIFEIREGTLRTLIEGKEYISEAGETLVIPKGKKHICYNISDGVLRCTVKYSPCLDQVRFTQCFSGLVKDGYIDTKQGSVNIPMMGYMLKKMKCKAMARPTSIPAPVFGLALNAFYLMGTLKGWGKLYTKYTGLA